MNILTRAERELLESLLRDRFDSPYDIFGKEQEEIISISEKLSDEGIIKGSHTRQLKADYND